MSIATSAVPAATTLRLAESGQGLTIFAGLCAGVSELADLRLQSEQDVARCRQLQRDAKLLPDGPAKRILQARLAREVASAEEQVFALQQAFLQLRHEVGDLARYDLPSAQRKVLQEDLAASEATLEQAAEELAALQAIVGPPAERTHKTNGAEASVLEARPNAAAASAPAGGAHGVPAADEPAVAAVPPVVGALDPGGRAELDALIAEVRALAYAVKAQPAGQPAAPAPNPTPSKEAGLQVRWAEWTERNKSVAEMSPNEMTQWVMRQAYIDNSQDMRLYAYKLEFQTALKARIRDELQRARQARSEQCRGGSKTERLAVPYLRKSIRKDARIDDKGAWHVRPAEEAGEIVDAEGLSDYIRELETALSTSSDDMQVAQLELQGMTQRQQQVLNALSNLSKTLHETSMAILRKIGS